MRGSVVINMVKSGAQGRVCCGMLTVNFTSDFVNFATEGWGRWEWANVVIDRVEGACVRNAAALTILNFTRCFTNFERRPNNSIFLPHNMI